jgi:hypothetical protein
MGAKPCHPTTAVHAIHRIILSKDPKRLRPNAVEPIERNEQDWERTGKMVLIPASAGRLQTMYTYRESESF